ncbi:unnamed protein product, partial [Ectocarpus sp. 8 AP-2014]
IIVGAYGRNKVEVKKRIDIVKSCITSADSVHLVRVLEILDGSMTGGVTWSFFLTGRIVSKTRFSRERLGSTCWYRFWVSSPCVAISSTTSRLCKRATVDEAPSLEILARQDSHADEGIWQHPCQPGEPQEPQEGASVCCW